MSYIMAGVSVIGAVAMEMKISGLVISKFRLQFQGYEFAPRWRIESMWEKFYFVLFNPTGLAKLSSIDIIRKISQVILGTSLCISSKIR